MLDAALVWIHRYGLLAVFVVVMLETAFLLHGAPIEIVVPSAAFFLATSPWSFAMVVLASATGATAGAIMLYESSRRGVAHLRGRRVRALLDRMQRAFTPRRANVLVLTLRLIPFGRSLVSVPAGAAKMPRVRYVGLTFAGNVAFSVLLAGLGLMLR